MFEKVTPELLQKAINNIKNRFDFEDKENEERIMQQYTSHREEINNVIKSKGFIK